jgi:hypothetical protein
MPLDLSEFLMPGKTYTITVTPGGVVSYLEHPDVGALTAALQGLNFMDAPQLAVATPVQVGGTDYYNVTFTYSGDGSDVVAGLYQEISDAFSGATAVTVWNFVGASEGGAGVPQQDQTGKLPSLPSVIPASGSLWAIVVILLIAAFMFSGGSSFLKRVLA